MSILVNNVNQGPSSGSGCVHGTICTHVTKYSFTSVKVAFIYSNNCEQSVACTSPKLGMIWKTGIETKTLKEYN